MARAPGWRKLRFRFDWTLTLAIATVIGFGLVNLWSAVRERKAQLYAQQVSWLGLGAIAFLAVASIDYRLFARLGYWMYGFGVVLLGCVLAYGKVVHGARRWFDLGPAHLQPSELMKLLTIIALGKYLNDVPALDGRSFRHIVIPGLMVAAPVYLIAKQPDLGTALLIVLIFVTVMLTARLRLRTAAASLAIGIVAAAPIWQYALHDYQRNRLLAFLNPSADPATAWQPRQAMNAVGSGRVLGKGFLHGTQIRVRNLPAMWTDFPFAVWAEEFGFLGCLAVLLAYAFLILWCVKIAAEARDRFGATLCIGVASLLFWQVIMNVGMVTGVLPVVGVTLPLFSYGGSSVLTCMVALGLVMNVSVRRFAY